MPFGALTDALATGDPVTREKAAQSLGFRGQAAAVPHLLKALDKPEPDRNVRRSIYLALGSLADPRGLAALDNCLEGETREEVRADCAKALGGFSGPAPRNRLIALLTGSEHILVRSRAVDALGSFPDDAAVTALAVIAGAPGPRSVALPVDRSSLAASRSPALKPRAIAALGRTGSRLAGRVLAALLNEATRAREHSRIIAALIAAPAPEAAERLAEIVANGKDDRLRAAATVALAAAGDRDGLAGTLAALLDDPAPLVQLRAIRGLVDLRADGVGPDLADYAQAQLAVIAAMTPEQMVDRVDVLLGRASLLDAALSALTELDAVAGLPTYLDAARTRPIGSSSTAALAVRNAIYQVRRTALYGLAYTDSDRAAAFLAGAAGAGDADPRLRAVAARSLAVLGRRDAVARLVDLLSDAAPEVRWTAADALGPLGRVEAVVPLAQSLTDQDARVRESAAKALALLPANAARAALGAAASEDSSPKVRKAAAFALQRLGPNE